MRTTSIVWPEADLGCPLRSAWAVAVKQRFASSTLNPPITTYAEDQHEEKRIQDCAFLWTRPQFGIFEAFYATTLLWGMRWFMMDSLVAGVMVPCYSHIVDGYTIGDNDGWVAIAFQLESYRRTGREVA